MNRFPIWKGKRIGRYDDRLILRSVIFFALTVAALSVFTIWMTERNILFRIFLLFLITVLCLLDLFYKWKSGSMVDIETVRQCRGCCWKTDGLRQSRCSVIDQAAEWNGSPIFRRFITEGKTGIFM